MVKNLLAFCFLILVSFGAYGQSWQPVGPDDNDQLFANTGRAFFVNMVNSVPHVAFVNTEETNGRYRSNIVYRKKNIGNNSWTDVTGEVRLDYEVNTIAAVAESDSSFYSVYQDIGANLSVRRYSPVNGWENVGAKLLTTSIPFLFGPGYLAIALDGKTPYVAFVEQNMAKRLTVMKLGSDGNTWEVVGTAGFSQGEAANLNLSIINHVPYVGFIDHATSYSATARVMKFDGAKWLNAVTGSINPLIRVSALSFKVSNSIPYVAYVTETAGARNVFVKKINQAANSWVDVTAAPIDAKAFGINLDFDGSTPYLSFSEHIDIGATIMRLNNNATAWEVVGNSSFTTAMASGIVLSFDDKKPYVVCNDSGYGAGKIIDYQLTADNKSWKEASVTGFTQGGAHFITLFFDNNTPYAIYSDWGNNRKATVRKFDGRNWQLVGDPVTELSWDKKIKLYFNNNTPFVAYVDYKSGNKATVKKLNAAGTAWETVGPPGFSQDVIRDISLYFVNNIPYAVYEETGTLGNGSRLITMKFVSGSWQPASNFAFGQSYNLGQLHVKGSEVFHLSYLNSNATLRKFDVGKASWETIGKSPFAIINPNDMGLIFDNESMPYIFSSRGVFKLDSAGNWVDLKFLGDPSSLALDGNTLYATGASVSYDKHRVYRYDAVDKKWTVISPLNGIAKGGVLTSSATVSNNKLYVAFDARGGFVKSYDLTKVITSFTPTSAQSNATVIISGKNLHNVTNVTFGGVAAKSFKQMSDSVITAVVGSGNSGPVSVVTQAGTFTLNGFTFLGVPSITSFSPASATTGQTVTITGTNFSGVTSVKFGNTAAESFIINSPTTITAVVGSGTTGTISVANPFSSTLSKSAFTYIPPGPLKPSITSFSPASATAGQSITITGTNFTDVTSVKFDTTRAYSFVVNSSTSITAIVGAGATGKISVANSTNSSVSTGTFTYITPVPRQPTITSFSPVSAIPGQSVTITGTNFLGLTSVKFGDAEAASFVVTSLTSATAVVGKGSTGKVTVANEIYSVTSTSTFTYFSTAPAPPSITSISSSSAALGSLVIIVGSNFTGSTAVSFGGMPARQFNVVSDKVIHATVGSGASGSVTVTTPGGTASFDGFKYVLAPVMTSFSPKTILPGTLVTINGENFNDIQKISFGGALFLNYTVVSPNIITAVVNNAGSGDVSVTAGGVTVSLPGFVLVRKPTIYAHGPTIFNSGGSVKLSTSRYKELSYKWARNGVDIPGAIDTGYVASVEGDYTVTTSANGLSNTSNITAVKIDDTLPARPVIIADGPATFILGGQVVLTAQVPAGNYTFQWLKGGQPVSGADKISYTATTGGYYQVVTVFNGTVTQKSEEFLVRAVFSLPANNFKLTATSATCKGSANGSISIEAAKSQNYMATLSIDGKTTTYKFTDSKNISNLPAGTYSICITVEGQYGYQQCFSSVIKEPKDLSLFSVVSPDGDKVVLNLGGGDNYHIKLNGIGYNTTNTQITLPLAKGKNRLSVSTDTDCQGIIQRDILVPYNAVYPNPFTDIVKIDLGTEQVRTVQVNVMDVGDAKSLYKAEYANKSGVITLNLPDLRAGIYLLKLLADNTETVFKIIRK